jgi:hypothetical protein
MISNAGRFWLRHSRSIVPLNRSASPRRKKVDTPAAIGINTLIRLSGIFKTSAPYFSVDESSPQAADFLNLF